MELESQTAKQTYIRLLAETLKKKIEILHNLMQLTQKQTDIIVSDEFSDEEFLKNISLKEAQLQALTQLDNGFEQLYEHVKEELATEREKYGLQIHELQDLVKTITDISVKLQTMEQRNKMKIETVFAVRRKEIKTARMSSQTVTNYYKTMANQQENQSLFYDKKK